MVVRKSGFEVRIFFGTTHRAMMWSFLLEKSDTGFRRMHAMSSTRRAQSFAKQAMPYNIREMPDLKLHLFLLKGEHRRGMFFSRSQ